MATFVTLYGDRLDRELGSADRDQLFTTERRKAAINEGQIEFADLAQCFTRHATFTIVSGTSEYNLCSTTILPSGDFLGMATDAVVYKAVSSAGAITWMAGDDFPQREIHWLDRFEVGWRTSTVAATVRQVPHAWYLTGEGAQMRLGFVSVPSIESTSASASAIVHYVGHPDVLIEETDEPFSASGSVRSDLRPYHQALVHYAAYLLEPLRQNAEASQAQHALALGYVQRYLSQRQHLSGAAAVQARRYFTEARRT